MTRPADPVDRHALAARFDALADGRRGERDAADDDRARADCESRMCVYRDAARLVREAPTLPAPAPAPAWRKEPPTADEVRTLAEWWWWRCSTAPQSTTHPLWCRIVDGAVEYRDGADEWHAVETLPPCDEWAPCPPPGAPEANAPAPVVPGSCTDSANAPSEEG